MKLIVTGGASGLGEALMRRLGGHEVWVLDRATPAALANGHRYIAADLSDPASIESALAALPACIDGVVNVAGIAAAEDPKTVLAVNFLGLRLLSEALVPRFEGRGRIVNVSSIAGRDWKAKHDRLRPLLETASWAEGMAWCAEHEAAFAQLQGALGLDQRKQRVGEDEQAR